MLKYLLLVCLAYTLFGIGIGTLLTVWALNIHGHIAYIAITVYCITLILFIALLFFSMEKVQKIIAYFEKGQKDKKTLISQR